MYTRALSLMMLTSIVLACAHPTDTEPNPAAAIVGTSENQSRTQQNLIDVHPPPLTLPFDVKPYFSTPEEKSALVHFRAKRYKQAAKAFDSLWASGPPHALQLRYLSAVSHYYAGHHEQVIPIFEDLIKTYPLLADYHRYFAAVASLKVGDTGKAIQLAKSVDRDGANGKRTSIALVSAMLKAGQPQKALDHLEEHIQDLGKTAQTQSLRAHALTALNRYEEAIVGYRFLLARWPVSSEARRAKEELETVIQLLPKAKRQDKNKLNAKEELLRGRQLFAKHRSREAIQQLTSAAARFQTKSEKRCEALFLTARSWDKLRKRPKGHPVYRQGLKECEDTSWQVKLLYFGGRSHYRHGKHVEALRFFRLLHKQYPQHSYNDDALLWTAYLHQSDGHPALRTQALERILRDYPNGDKKDQAAWLLLWDVYSKEDMAKTLSVADENLRLIPRESYRWTKGRTLYWKARALSKLGRKKEAIATYRTVLETYPMTYYALVSYSRLVQAIGDSAAASLLQEVIHADAAPTHRIIDRLNPSLLKRAAFQRGLELTRLGLTVPAKWEFALLNLGEHPDEEWILALLFHRAGAHSLAHNIPRRKRSEYREHYPIGAHRERWLIAYPRPFETLVTQHAATANLDADIAYAIMRTESGFNPEIESPANAVGLLQLILPTAKWLARGEPGTINRQVLKDPDRNLQLGTRFLGQLQQRFGHPGIMATGYNAGRGAADRWVREFGTLELDAFVENIPYREARRYAKSVLNSLATYRLLYKGNYWPVPLQLPTPTP